MKKNSNQDVHPRSLVSLNMDELQIRGGIEGNSKKSFVISRFFLLFLDENIYCDTH